MLFIFFLLLATGSVRSHDAPRPSTFICSESNTGAACIMNDVGSGNCVTVDSAKNAFYLSCGTSVPLAYRYVLPTRVNTTTPISLVSRAVDWSTISEYDFYVNTTVSWVNTAIVVQYGPIVQLCLDGTCCLGTVCSIKLADLSMRVLSLDASGKHITAMETGSVIVTVDYNGRSITAPLVPINGTHSWADWNMATGMVQNISFTRTAQC